SEVPYPRTRESGKRHRSTTRDESLEPVEALQDESFGRREHAGTRALIIEVAAKCREIEPTHFSRGDVELVDDRRGWERASLCVERDRVVAPRAFSRPRGETRGKSRREIDRVVREL